VQFRIVARCPTTRARAGVLETPHGAIETPAFMPVGTQGTVKALLPSDLASTQAQCILANAYHLAIRPGARLVERLGGLHRMMGWDRPILTDSGGFQIFSLANLRELDEQGVTIVSHLDGRPRRFTPRSVIRIEEQLGADLIMPLDVCLGYPSARQEAERALEVTHDWARRAARAHRRSDQALFAIVQGGMEADLRAQSARTHAAEQFPGYAIGGLSVGEPRETTDHLVEVCTAELPEDRPRYLMGVGEPDQLVAYAARGVDLFDCVSPTRLGRTGNVYATEGRLNLAKAAFRDDPGPIDAACDCRVCARHSRAYLHHLLRGGETLGARLLSLHNVAFLVALLRRMREGIVRGEPTAQMPRSEPERST
jgi:queuine tRNA-ribosyltransferase